ncbi:uncharacterized mitochondrial protein-like protein [Tanacetum coccineum]
MVVAESSQTPVKDTTLTFQCLIITSTNFTIWRMRMKVLLGIHGVWDVVDPGLDDAKKKNIVKGLLFQSIPEYLEARLQTLITEFDNLEMLDNGTIDEYVAKLSGIASKSATLGEVMSEHKLVKKFLTCLPRCFVHIVAALEQVLDLKTTGGGSGRGSYSRGRGRGRGQGRGQENSQNHGQRDTSKNHEDNEQKGKQHEKHDLSHIHCYRCDQYGHFVSKCPERNRNHEVNLNETQEKGVYHGNVISLGQAAISSYDISIRGDFLTMRDSWGSLLIKVSRNGNRLYKAQLKVGKEVTNEVGRESGTFTVLCNNIEVNVTNLDEEANPHISLVTVHETSLESEEDNSRSDDTPNLLVRLKTIRLLIALAVGKGWKIHHLDVKMDFINDDRKKLDSTLKEIGFLQCVHEKAVYRKIASMSDLGELTYYLGIKVSQGKDYVEIKQERYARKILKEAGMEDCNATSYPMEKDLKLSKAEDKPEVEAT